MLIDVSTGLIVQTEVGSVPKQIGRLCVRVGLIQDIVYLE